MSAKMTKTQQCSCGKRSRDLVLSEITDEGPTYLCHGCATKESVSPPDWSRAYSGKRTGRCSWGVRKYPHITAKQKKLAKEEWQSWQKNRGPSGRGTVHVTPTGGKVGEIKHRHRKYAGKVHTHYLGD